MITTVTGGVVSVEDGTKAAEEYSPARKVRVELHFAVPEGGSAAPVLDAVSTLAAEKVDQLLGRRAAPLSASSTVTLPGSESQDPPKTRTRRTAAQIAADEALKKADPAVDPTLPLDDPSAVGDEDIFVSTAQPEDPAGGFAADPSAIVEDDLTTAGPVTTITDDDLNAAVQKRNAELKAPPVIRELIGSFAPDRSKPFSLSQIPQAQRQDFLDKLAALSAPA